MTVVQGGIMNRNPKTEGKEVGDPVGRSGWTDRTYGWNFRV